jgi:hypothetical protein
MRGEKAVEEISADMRRKWNVDATIDKMLMPSIIHDEST